MSEAAAPASEASTPQALHEVPEIHAAETLLPDEELTALPVPEHSEVAAEGPEPQLEVPHAALREPVAPEPEFELDQDFELVLEPEPVVPAHEMLSQIPVPPTDAREGRNGGAACEGDASRNRALRA